MSTSYKIITPPTVEPISTALVRDWLRIDWYTDDAIVKSLITQARSYAETVTHRALATQTIQMQEMIDRPIGGDLSGPITPGASWYQYSQQLGANPFGATQFYFDLAMPPFQPDAGYTIETKVTVFDPWVTFTGNTYADNNVEPGRIYVFSPITANVYRFTYQAGYDNDTYQIPPDLKQCLLDLCTFFYDHRDGEDVPQSIINRLLAKRVDWL